MIPTAEDFITDGYYYLELLPEGTEVCISKDEVIKKMIEFAKMHVEYALQAASELAKTKSKKKTGVGYSTLDKSDIIDKKSILKAYSLDNIK